MIVIPQLNPSLLKTFESDFGTSIAQVLWRKIVDHVNWLNAALPVGTVEYFHGGQLYANGDPIAPPNSCWQLCDGSVVSNPNSPLNGQTLPDMRGRFLKGGTTPGTTGGSDTMNLAHSHGGATAATFDGEDSFDSAGGSAQGGPSFHNHSISTALGTVSRLPPYAELQPYMRIV